jgi:hypothetical protein
MRLGSQSRVGTSRLEKDKLLLMSASGVNPHVVSCPEARVEEHLQWSRTEAKGGHVSKLVVLLSTEEVYNLKEALEPG